MTTQHEINGWMVDSDEDIWADGCTGRGDTYFSDERLAAPDIPTLIAAVLDRFGASEDAMLLDFEGEEPGRIDLQLMEDENHNEPTDHEIEQWKAGEKRLWLATYIMQVERVTREPVALAEAWAAR